MLTENVERTTVRGVVVLDLNTIAGVTFDWVGIVEREGTALGDAAAADPTAPVPAASGWDTIKLLRHIGLIHARTSVILRS